jgi:hypothetical protein
MFGKITNVDAESSRPRAKCGMEVSPIFSTAISFDDAALKNYRSRKTPDPENKFFVNDQI